MAYAKKVTRRRYRSSRYRRRAWRRRYRYNKYRRYYRRTRRRTKVEYKRVEFHHEVEFQGNIVDWPGASNLLKTHFYVSPDYYSCFIIGSSNYGPGVAIGQGTGTNKRIGAKITPVTLRLFGSMSIMAKDQSLTFDQNDAGLKGIGSVNQVMVRMLVFQVRNGSPGIYDLMSSGFSSINPIRTTKLATDGSSILQYNNRNATEYLDPEWFWRMFTIEKYITRQEDTNTKSVIQTIIPGRRANQAMLAKAPYRNGIGSSVKILKSKLYYLRPFGTSTFAFRTKIKRMHRMVWPESPAGLELDEITVEPRNPIYITFIPIFPTGLSAAQITINYQGQLYYTDK